MRGENTDRWLWAMLNGELWCYSFIPVGSVSRKLISLPFPVVCVLWDNLTWELMKKEYKCKALKYDI
jgi:hypothetical protein